MSIDSSSPARLSLRGRLAFLAKDSMLYGGAAMVAKMFSLVSFPLLTRSFPVEEYGLINYFTVLSGLMGVAFVFGQDSAVARYFYEYEDTERRREVISQSLCMQAAGVVLLLPVLWLVSGHLLGWMPPTPHARAIFALILLQVPFVVAINFSVNLLKWTFQRARFLIMSLGAVAVNLALLLASILWLKVRVEGVFAVILLNNAMFAVLGLFFIRKWLMIPRRFQHAGSLMAFAAPFGVVGILAAFVPFVERSTVQRLLGARELGLYAAASGAAALISMFTGAFQTAWGPFSLAIHKSESAEETYNWVLKGFVIAVCGGALLLAALARPLIVALASDRYLAAASIVFPLAMGLGIQAAGWVTEIGISISKKAYLGLLGYAIYVAVGLAGILLLGKHFGMYGVAFGSLIGYAAKGVVQSALAQYAYRLPWSYGNPILLILMTLAIALLARWAEVAGAGSASTVIFLTGAVFVTAFGWFGFFSSVERGRITRVATGAWSARFRRPGGKA